MGGGLSPGGPQAVGGGGAGGVASAGPGSDGARAVRRAAGPCEAAGRWRAREQQGSGSRVPTAPPAAQHLPPEPPARVPALLPQQHLRREHQKSTKRRARGGGDGGSRAAGDPPWARGGARLRRPPRPSPATAVRGAERGPERAPLCIAAKHAHPEGRERGGGSRAKC